MTTKWDLLSEVERTKLAAQPCALNCTGCNAYLATQADLAAHFVSADRRFLNRGECPETEKGREVIAKQERLAAYRTRMDDQRKAERAAILAELKRPHRSVLSLFRDIFAPRPTDNGGPP